MDLKIDELIKLFNSLANTREEQDLLARALQRLDDHSFDAVQDSRLFGSPEFTAQFPEQADRLMVAEEIWKQEQRLLKPEGIVIHSDAAILLRKNQ